MCWRSAEPGERRFLASGRARDLLAHNGLASFAALWRLPEPWMEPPNRNRGGWSGVVRRRLRGEDGEVVEVFVKRQANHTYRGLPDPWRTNPTALRELRHLLDLRRRGFVVPYPLGYAERRRAGAIQAVLVTLGLAEAVTFTEALARSPGGRGPLLQAAAALLARLHGMGLQHGALYGKHLLVVGPETGSPTLALIDLEKMRRRPPLLAAASDLSQLARTIATDRREWSAFMATYLQRSAPGPARHLLPALVHWKTLAKNHHRRRKHRTARPLTPAPVDPLTE